MRSKLVADFNTLVSDRAPPWEEKKGRPCGAPDFHLPLVLYLSSRRRNNSLLAVAPWGDASELSSYKSAKLCLALLELLDSGWQSHYYSPRLPRLTLSHHNEVMGYFPI